MTFGEFFLAIQSGYSVSSQAVFVIELLEKITHFEEKTSTEDQLLESRVERWLNGSRKGCPAWIKKNGWTKACPIDDSAFFGFMMPRMLTTWREVQVAFKAVHSDNLIKYDTTNEREFWQSVLCQFKVIVGVPLTIDEMEKFTPLNKSTVCFCGFDKEEAEKQNSKMGDVFGDHMPIVDSSRQPMSTTITISYEDSSYVGEYITDKNTGQPIPNGHGKLVWNSGSSYIGEFVCGVRCGLGTLTDRYGKTTEAIWKNNDVSGGVKITSDMGVLFGFRNAEQAFVNRIEFKNGYTFEGTLLQNSMTGKLYHPDGRFGRFMSNSSIGLKILSGDDDIRRKILKLPDVKLRAIYYDNGNVYVGEINNDEIPHGYGRIVFTNEMILEIKTENGEVVDNRGIWIFPHGYFDGFNSLDCIWRDNSWHGSHATGEFTAEFTLTDEGNISSIKAVYADGSWEEILARTAEGYIRMRFSDGSEYKGDENWRLHSGYARGVFTDSNGCVWNGEWMDGMKNGEFTVADSDRIAQIRYENDVPVGHYVMTAPDGAVFEFEVQNGDFDGRHIKLTYPDKSTYEGEGDSSGLPDGQGTFAFADGRIFSGKWVKGSFDDNGTYIDVVGTK